MERGSLALFGAIVAVGLGPAMWLGAQFGTSTVTPQRPPAVTVNQGETTAPEQGGVGAGSLPTDPAQIIGNDVAADPQPVKTREQLPVPITSSPSPDPSPSDTPDNPPSTEPPAPPSQQPSEDPSTPPTESATEPVPDPSDDETPEVPEPQEPSGPVILPEDDVIPVTA